MNTLETWRIFLIELEFARNYPMAYQLTSNNVVGRNPVLEEILPSLLHLRMTAVLDGALEAYLDSTGTSLPADYRSDLNGRICFSSDSGLVPNGQALHRVRKRRNDTAHEVFSNVSWKQLEQDRREVHAALQHLGLVSEPPQFLVKAERSAFRESDEPGVMGHHDFVVRVMEGEKCAGEFKWRTTLHNDSVS